MRPRLAIAVLAFLIPVIAFAGMDWGAVVDGYNQSAEAERRREQQQLQQQLQQQQQQQLQLQLQLQLQRQQRQQQALDNQRLLIEQQRLLIEQQRQEADLIEIRHREATRAAAEESEQAARKVAEEKAGEQKRLKEIRAKTAREAIKYAPHWNVKPNPLKDSAQ